MSFKVLIVDDEEIIRHSICNMVPWADLDCSVIGTAANGIEAYQVMIDNCPDIVLTDMRMPVMDGLDLISKGKKLSADMEFVVLSGYSEFSLAQEAMKYGVQHYILKPANEDDISSVILQVVSKIKKRRIDKEQETRDIIRNFGLYAYKGILQELATRPADISKVLERNKRFLGIDVDKNVVLVKLDVAGMSSLIVNPFVTSLVKTLEDTGISEVFIPCQIESTLVLIFETTYIHAEESIQSIATLKGFKIIDISYMSLLEAFKAVIGLLYSGSDAILLGNDGQSERLSTDNTLLEKVLSVPSMMESVMMDPSLKAQLLKDISVCSISDAKTLVIGLAVNLSGSGRSVSEHVFTLIRDMTDMNSLIEFADKLIQTRSGNDQYVYPIKDIIEYVRNHLSDESLSLKYISENVLYMNVGYLSKLFIREVGVKFSEFLNRERIDKAKKLMEMYPDTPIKEIASAVGFASYPRYFSQVFRKYEGIIPSDYVQAFLSK